MGAMTGVGFPRDGTPGDEALLAAVRAGELDRFGDLYRRHVRAALHLARSLQPSREAAEDLVAEAFTRVLKRLVAGAGPDTAFRPYLLATVRTVIVNAARDTCRTEPKATTVEPDRPTVDPVSVLLESTMVARAFATLPSRWREVLWLTEVEGETPGHIAPLLGLTSNAVSSLILRAKEGLRIAYLQTHVATTTRPGCAEVAPRLSAWLSRRTGMADTIRIDLHLRSCRQCASTVRELREVATGFRRLCPNE